MAGYQRLWGANAGAGALFFFRLLIATLHPRVKTTIESFWWDEGDERDEGDFIATEQRLRQVANPGFPLPTA